MPGRRAEAQELDLVGAQRKQGCYLALCIHFGRTSSQESRTLSQRNEKEEAPFDCYCLQLTKKLYIILLLQLFLKFSA
jgi:hypothetical protein